MNCLFNSGSNWYPATPKTLLKTAPIIGAVFNSVLGVAGYQLLPELNRQFMTIDRS